MGLGCYSDKKATHGYHCFMEAFFGNYHSISHFPSLEISFETPQAWILSIVYNGHGIKDYRKL